MADVNCTQWQPTNFWLPFILSYTDAVWRENNFQIVLAGVAIWAYTGHAEQVLYIWILQHKAEQYLT